MSQENGQRSRVRAPASWERLESRRTGPFQSSREVYRLPDSSEYVWEARRHRKGRGLKAATGAAVTFAERAPGGR